MKSDRKVSELDRQSMERHFADLGLTFEGKPLPFEMAPYLFEADLDQSLQLDFEELHKILEKVVRLYASHSGIRSFYGYPKQLEQLIHTKVRTGPAIHLARFDYTFESAGRPKIYETNSECPGGLLLMRKIFAGYKTTQFFKELEGQGQIAIEPYPHYLYPIFGEALVDTVRDHQSLTAIDRGEADTFDHASAHQFAILKSRHNTLTNEVDLMVEELIELGHNAHSAFVEETTLTEAGLLSQGRLVDLCYQKFDFIDDQTIPLTREPHRVAGYIEGVAKGQVLAVNSFASSYLIENKATLALFWDPEMMLHFSEAELELARRLFVKTRLVSRMSTSDLAEARLRREHLVLKKGLDSRGRSVILGKNRAAADWDLDLKKAFTETSIPYVLQEFVPHEKDTSAAGTQFISHAYFMLRGKAVGPLTRFSKSEVTNVGQQGSLGIAFRARKSKKHQIDRGEVSEFSAQVRRAARRLNQQNTTPAYFAEQLLPLPRELVATWAGDILKLKTLICDLPFRTLGGKTTVGAALPEWARHDPMTWTSGVFRPDCILTDEGLKIIEMNIDNGSLSLTASLAAKAFYNLIPGFFKTPAVSSYEDPQSVISVEDKTLTYFLREQTAGQSIFIWDLKDRSVSLSHERTKELAFLRSRGLKVELALGDEILGLQKDPSAFVFRYFAYPHFFNKSLGLQEVFRNLSSDFISRNDLGLSSLLHDSKINLARLHDPEVRAFLTASERELVKTYIPPSYHLKKTGENLSTFASDRHRWVLKQGTGFQGKAVFIGAETPADQWALQLAAAATAEDCIVQEVLSPLKLPISLTDGTHSQAEVTAHILNLYFVDNVYAGMNLRLRAGSTSLKIGAVDGRAVVAGLPVLG